MKNLYLIPTDKPSKLYKVKEKFYIEEYPVTTDQSLDGVQAIDDEFLEWFIKNPSSDMVEIESNYIVKSGTIQDIIKASISSKTFINQIK